MSKPTGLAAFTRKPSPASPVDPETNKSTPTAAETEPGPRMRGKGATVALTVRLTRSQWERLHQLAVSEGVSIQQLAVRGLSHVFGERGLPKL